MSLGTAICGQASLTVISLLCEGKQILLLFNIDGSKQSVQRNVAPPSTRSNWLLPLSLFCCYPKSWRWLVAAPLNQCQSDPVCFAQAASYTWARRCTWTRVLVLTRRMGEWREDRKGRGDQQKECLNVCYSLEGKNISLTIRRKIDDYKIR